jgi:hypothetical protein
MPVARPKALHMTMVATWYVPNTVIRRDLQIPNLEKKSTVTARLSAYGLLVNLMELPGKRRLRRHLKNDLSLLV